MNREEEVFVEIPVIVLDQQGEVAFWSKLTRASRVTLDKQPFLQKGAFSYNPLPPIQSVSVSTPKSPIIYPQCHLLNTTSLIHRPFRDFNHLFCQNPLDQRHIRFAQVMHYSGITLQVKEGMLHFNRVLPMVLLR